MIVPPSQDLKGYPLRDQWRAGSLRYTPPRLLMLFVWLFWGDLAWSLRDRTTLPVMQVMLQKYQASDLLTSVLLGCLPYLMSIVISPIVSYRSDRYRGRWGRRIPFLFWPTPIIALAMFGLAASPVLGDWLEKATGISSLGPYGGTLAVMALAWTVFELAAGVANSVFGALVADVVPQKTLGLFYGAFRAISLVAGIAFNFWFFPDASLHSGWIFVATGVIYALGLSLMCWKVKEGTYPEPEKTDGAGPLHATRHYLRDCFSNSYYWWIYASGAAIALAMMPFNIFSFAYASQMKVDVAMYGKASALTFLISLMFSMPLGYMADRLHPLRVMLGLQAMFLLAALASGLWVKDAATFLISFVLQGVLAGSIYTAGASSNARILPPAYFAQIASAGGIFTSAANIIFSPLLGIFLDRVTHHNYRFVFWVSVVCWSISLALATIVYRNFIRNGGVHGYVAPDPTENG